MLSQYSLLAKKMDTTQLFSIAIVFLCWSCNGEKTLREVPTRTLKQNAKSLEYRNDAKLKLLNSLLESKAMGDAHKKKVKFAGKPSEKVKHIESEKEEAPKKMTEFSSENVRAKETAIKELESENTLADLLSRYSQSEEEGKQTASIKTIDDLLSRFSHNDDEETTVQEPASQQDLLSRFGSTAKDSKPKQTTGDLLTRYQNSKSEEAMKDVKLKESLSSQTDQASSKSAKDLLIEEIAKMTEDNAAELAHSIIKSKLATAASDASTKPETKHKDGIKTEGRVKATGAAATSQDSISDVSKLVSHGYNLIRGCPEGQFLTGGTDPGLMTSKQIFKFSFKQDKTDEWSYDQPDQVEYVPKTETSVEQLNYVYGGEKSYRDELTARMSAAGTHKAYQFSASDVVATVHQETTTTQSIFLDRTQTLTVGEVRYLHNEDDLDYDITDEFYAAVMSLPVRLYFGLSAEEKQLYQSFIEEWGTDVIVKAEVGLRYLTRYRSNYTSAFLFAELSNNDPIEAGKVGSGIVSINIDTLRAQLLTNPSSEFGSEELNIEDGTMSAPVPTKLYLEPITRALDDKFWMNRLGDSTQSAEAAQAFNYLLIRRTNLEWQLEGYAEEVGTTLQDPDMNIPIKWPQGTYSLPKTTSGCPSGFSSGCRTQDNEDTQNMNTFSFNIDWDMQGEFDNDNNDVETCFCSKTEEGDSIFAWMPGRYCINRKGGTCPEDFSTGYIEWDDEDNNNLNDFTGELPDGEYPKSRTRIEYCCRNDGSTEDDILLPNTQPLVLYPYEGSTCQEVHGMESMQHYVYTDDEDESNEGVCVDEVPYVPNDCTLADIKITYCYYQPR